MESVTDTDFMRRCLQLASLGQGFVAPNPMVGAVLVHNQAIIAEGFHQAVGGPHAEVDCLNKLTPEQEHLLPECTLYVSLEPCSHFGKTPPCADLLIAKKIKKVVVACEDVNPQVAGKGIAKLRANGIAVTVGVLGKEARLLNKRFFLFHQQKRPYIVLKWAQSADEFIADASEHPTKISSTAVDRLVHQWRAEEQAILIGYTTALKDNPHLTTRYQLGNNPIRLVIDRRSQLPASNHVFDQQAPTYFLHPEKNGKIGTQHFIKIDFSDFIPSLMHALYQLSIQSVLVEGGTFTLQQFIDTGIWEEAKVITNVGLTLGSGVKAPSISNSAYLEELVTDQRIQYYQHTSY